MEQKFVTPPNHFGFRAARLFGEQGLLLDGALAYIEPGGGGPEPAHTHETDHLFYVIEGELAVRCGGETITIHAGEARRVPGAVPHATQNPGAQIAKVLGLTVAPARGDA